jgi:hypothetical protein
MRRIGIWPLTPDTHAYVAANGLWSDGRCRAIALVLFSVPGLGRRGDVDRLPGAAVGAWTIVQDTPEPCTNALTAPGRCLEYESRPIGQHWPKVLILQMRGIGREAGDAIARSIPTGQLDAPSARLRWAEFPQPR